MIRILKESSYGTYKGFPLSYDEDGNFVASLHGREVFIADSDEELRSQIDNANDSDLNSMPDRVRDLSSQEDEILAKGDIEHIRGENPYQNKWVVSQSISSTEKRYIAWRKKDGKDDTTVFSNQARKMYRDTAYKLRNKLNKHLEPYEPNWEVEHV